MYIQQCRKVIRPLHGLRVKNIYEENLTVLEKKMQCGFTEVYGVIVDKVCLFLCINVFQFNAVHFTFWFRAFVIKCVLFSLCVCVCVCLQIEDLSAEHSGIKVGDVITHVNGVPFSNAAEVCCVSLCL